MQSTRGRTSKRAAAVSRPTVRKVSVSLSAEDVGWAKEEAASRRVSLSAVLSEALQKQRRSAALGRLLTGLGGKLSPADLAALRAELYSRS